MQIHEYSLGNGLKTTNPSTAMDEFMKREFQDILNFLENPHDVIFIPDTFQYGSRALEVKPKNMSVVYFNQEIGAAHCICWSQ